MTTIIDQATPLPATEIVSPLASRMLFWRSRYQQDSAALYHLPFLFWLVEVMRPRTTVTLGLGDGVAHFGLCQAVDKLGLPTRCHGVDEWPAADAAPIPAAADAAPSPTASGNAVPVVPAAIASHNDANYAAFSVIEAVAPSTLLARLAPGKVDLLWVDAAMTAQMTDALIYAWPTKLSPHGVILLHGVTRHFASDAGQSLLAGLKAAHRTLFFPAGDGLLVVLWGPDQPYRLARLAEMGSDSGGDPADAAESAEIQQIFARLGLLHRLEWVAPQAQAQAAEARTARQAALAALETIRKDHDDLHKSYAARTSAAARHQAEAFDLRDRNAALEQAQAGMAALQQEVDRLRRENSAGAQSAEDRSREIVALTQALAGLHAEKTAALAALSMAGSAAAARSASGSASGPKHRGLVHRIKASRMMSPVRRMVRRLKGQPPPGPPPGPQAPAIARPGPRPTLMQRIKRSRVMAPVRSVVRRYRSGH